MSRRQAREDALKLLYLRDLCGADAAAAEAVIYGSLTSPSTGVMEFSRALFNGVAVHQTEKSIPPIGRSTG